MASGTGAASGAGFASRFGATTGSARAFSPHVFVDFAVDVRVEVDAFVRMLVNVEQDVEEDVDVTVAVRVRPALQVHGTQGEMNPTAAAAPASTMAPRRACPRDSPPCEARGSRIVRSRSSNWCGRVSASAGVGCAGEPSERKMPSRCPA